MSSRSVPEFPFIATNIRGHCFLFKCHKQKTRYQDLKNVVHMSTSNIISP